MKRSSLEAKREAAAYTSDVGTSLDDSDISSHEADSDFDADDIIARRVGEEDGMEVLQYLVKFTDYPLYRSEWLNTEKLSKVLLDGWTAKRREMGAAKLEHISDENSAKYDAAKKKASAAKQRRHQKREQVRQSAAQKKEESLKKKGAAKTIAPPALNHAAPAKSNAKQAASSERKRRIVVDSSDEDVSMATSSDSSDDEPLLKRRSNPRSNGTELGASATLLSKPSSLLRKLKSLAGASSSVDKPSSGATPSAVTGRRPSMPLGPQDRGPIKIVNEPKQPQRKAWDTHGKHFTTLHYRAVAEKRSRAEGTPDINELEFVNGRPAGIPTKTADTTSHTPARNNPYGRRESGQLRLEIETEDGPLSTTTGVALQSYEKGKIPMVCYDWKHTTCIRSAEDCRFLHREHDQDGKLLPATNWKGEVPPKYRTPPETCWTWFCEGICKYPDEKCVFAHENTGHLKKKTMDPHIEPGSAAAREIAREIGGGPKYPDVTCVHWLMDTKGCLKSSYQCEFAHRNTGILGNTIGVEFRPIDPNLKPVNFGSLPKFQDPPQTCFFWLRGFTGCTRRGNDCIYAHENTGYLAHNKQGVLKIDPNERPRFEPARHRLSMPAGPVSTGVPARELPMCMKTCFFWNIDKCNIPEEDCKCLHRYTGVVANPPPGWVAPRGFQLEFRRDPVPMQPHVNSPIPMQVDEPMGELVYESAPQSLDKRDNGSSTSRHADPHAKDSRLLSPQQNRTDVVSANKSFDVNHKIEKVMPQENRHDLVSAGQPFDVKHKIEKVMPLDLDEMLRCNGDQYEDVVAGPNALILYDPEVYVEQPRLLERWLALNYMTIFNTLRMGFDAAWNAFKEVILDGGSGIIIAPPDFDDYASLPGFGDVLRGTVRIWSVGYQPGAGYNMWDPNASKDKDRTYDRFAIFPHGGIIYITDDVFEKEPQLALAIFKHFFAKIEAGRNVDSDIIPGMYINDGILLWRIGVRPELLKWIGDICMNHQAEIEGEDPDYVSLEKLYMLLHDSGYCEPDGYFDPPADNRRLDFFPVISMRQDLAEDVGLYYEARKHSHYEANTDMACHYSGLVVMERRNYRHFFVVHTNPEMVDWKETITNIDEVITPEKCIEYFEQEPKGCKFDNYEWSYPAKRVDSVTASSSDNLVQKKQSAQNSQCATSSDSLVQKKQCARDSQCATCGLNSAECPCDYV